MQDTIFTRIIKGEIPSHKIYEDERTLAFLDIHPAQPGHTLVIPKCQIEFLWDLDEADYAAVMATAKKVAQHLRSSLAVPYVGVKVIGVDVPHAHVQLIPFETVDGYDTKPNGAAEPDWQALSDMAEKLAL